MMTQTCLVRGIRARWLNFGFAALAAVALLTWRLAAAAEPLADLKSGVVALDGQRYAAAIATLKPLGPKLPKLADYAAWFLASPQFESKNYSAVPEALKPVWAHT